MTPAARPSLVPNILSLTNAPAVIRSFQTNRSLIVTLKAHEKSIAERTFTCATCRETFHNRAPFNAYVSTAHQQQQTGNRKRSPTTSNDAPAAKKSKRRAQASASTASEPSATPQSAPQASAATAGSSWQADPVLIPSSLVSSSDEDITQMYR